MKRHERLATDMLEHFHRVITIAGLMAAREDIENGGLGEKITMEQFLAMANRGFKVLRASQRELYDSFLGATFCIGISKNFPSNRFELAKPEDRSYDLKIIKLQKDQSPRFKTPGTDWFGEATEIDLEITELDDFSDKAANELIQNKLITSQKDYRGRVLLISASGPDPIDFKKLSGELRKNNENFKNIWLIGQLPATPKGSQYQVMELLQDPIYSRRFVIALDLQKIKDEVLNLKRFVESKELQ